LIKYFRMVTAIPVIEGRLREHFGGGKQFALVRTDPAQRKLPGIRTVTAPPQVPGLFPRWLKEQGANVVIASDIGWRALAISAQQDIAVRAGQPGATIEEMVNAYLYGRLVNEPTGCTHHPDDADGHPHDETCTSPEL
jgi:predicted Fe-Mo cluster-binding NifX family protein